MGFRVTRIDDRISRIEETGVADFMRCNIWHVRGRDCDLVIDTGFGVSSLKTQIAAETDRPVKAICTHSHFDHVGGLHEFDCRLGHRDEAPFFAAGGREAVLYTGDWTRIEVVDPRRHPDFDPATYSVTPAPLTGYIDEGDVVDQGDVAWQVLHLPGHSPGSVGLYDPRSGTLFSGDAVYDGDLLDSHPHSDKATYRHTLERLLTLDCDAVHGGHYASFGRDRMHRIVHAYLDDGAAMGDVLDWYESYRAAGGDPYG